MSFHSSIRGRLVHRKNLEPGLYYLRPRIGPKRIKCTFKKEHEAEFDGAVGRLVSVYGVLIYERPGGDFPCEILAINPPKYLEEKNVNLFRELRGKESKFLDGSVNDAQRRAGKRSSAGRNARGLRAALYFGNERENCTGYIRHVLNTGICFWCECEFIPKELTIDHFIPLSRGGGHTISNIVACCERCNREKLKLLPGEYIQQVWPEICVNEGVNT